MKIKNNNNKKLSNLSFIQGTRVSSVKSELMELDFLCKTRFLDNRVIEK